MKVVLDYREDKRRDILLSFIVELDSPERLSDSSYGNGKEGGKIGT